MRRHPATVSTIFLFLLALALLALTHCQPPEASREIELPPTYTRVPFTPVAAQEENTRKPLPTVPATYTPEAVSLLVGLSFGSDVNRRAEEKPTVDLSGLSNVIVVRRTASATATPFVVPTTIQTATSAPATPTPTPAAIQATATVAPAPTATPAPPIGSSTPVPPPSATPMPTSTSSPQPPTNSPTPQPTATLNPKKGIAATFANRYENGHEPFSPSWYYTWTLNPGLWQGPEFIPMWYCTHTPAHVLQVLGADYDGYLLFLNEPDRVEQCHQTIEEAVDYYLMVRSTLPQAKLIGPQTINSTNLNFGAWTGAWREAVRQRTGSYPDVAGYGFHVYPYYNGDVTTRQAMQSWCDSLSEWGELGVKEIWVTEFGVHNFDGTPQEVQAELTGMLDLFENGMGSCQVDRYAYYTERRVLIEGAPTPTIAPGGLNYWDLFWRNSWQLSYTGQVYADH